MDVIGFYKALFTSNNKLSTFIHKWYKWRPRRKGVMGKTIPEIHTYAYIQPGPTHSSSRSAAHCVHQAIVHTPFASNKCPLLLNTVPSPLCTSA